MSAFADLHRHLDGSLRPSTLVELAAANGVDVPEPFGFFPGMGLHAALACFEVTLSVLQSEDAVRRVASEICEDAQAENVITLEIRFAPQLHKGAPVEAIVDAAIEGVDGRAGLILCGLFGEPPSVLEHLVETARTRPQVVGIDLAGGPLGSHSWSLADYAPAYTRARDLGIGRTVHASEGRPPHEIRTAIVNLHAQRIGHGTTLLEDARVVDLVLEQQIVLEACPTSNLQTGVIPSIAAHPLPQWLALGICATVCTDNTLLSAVDLPGEYERVAAIDGMTASRIQEAVRHGHEGAFKR